MPQIVQDDITGLTHEFPDDVTPEEVEEALNKESSSFMRRALGDTGISLLQGAVGAAESAVGLLNIPTGGYAGKAMEDMFGANFQASRKFLEESKTSEQQQANRNVQEAEGFWDTVGAGIKNPSSIVGSIAESVASTIGAGGVGRGVVGLGRRFAPVVTEVLGTAAPAIAGAIGEGVISTGSAAEQIRQENDDRLLSPKQIALAIGSGATTSIIGILGGRMASKLGVGDIDALASGAVSSGAKKSILKRAADAVVSSGIEGLEELGQSANEKAAQNIALNKPWSEGVAEAAASGMLAGIGMGIGGGILHGSGSDAPTFDARADRVARNLQDPRYAQIYYGPAKVVAPEMPQGTRYGFEDLNDEELRELYRRSRIEYSNSPSSELGGSIKRIEFEIKQRTNPTPSQTVDIANLQEVTDAATLASIKETAAKDAEARAAADAAMGPPEAAAVEQPKVAPEMGIKPSVADLGLMTPDEAIQAGVDRGSYYVAVTDAFRNEKITESEYRLRAEIDPSKWPSVKAGDDVYVPRWNDSGKVMNVGYGWMDVLNKKGKITKQNADLELLSEWNKRREDEANILPVAQPPPPAAPPKAAAVEHDAELTDTSGKLKDGELGIGDGYGWVIDGYEFHGDVVEVGDGWRKIKLDNGNSVVKITFVDSEPKVAPEMGIKPSVTVEYMKEVGRLPLDTLADELHALGAGENTWISKHSPRDAQGFASNSLPSRQDLERLHGKRFTDTELSMLQQAYEDGRAIDFDAPPAAPPKAAAAEPTAEAGKPVVEPGQGGVPYYRKLGGYDAADPSRKRMRPVPQNFKLAYLDGWYEAKKAKPAAPGAAAQKPVVTSVPETVELNELRITKEQRGLGRLNLERLAELEAKEKAGTLDNPPAAPGATAQKMPWEKAQEVAKTFTPFTPEAKLTFPSRGVYQIDSPVAKIIGQVEGVYIRDKIDESAGSVFIVEATEHKKGGGTLVFKDAVRYLQSIGKTKVVLQGIHTEGGKALIAKMVRDGVIGKQIDKFDSATQVHDITKPDLKPTPPSATGSAAQKMAWEMTRDEYHNYNAESIISDYEGGGTERRGYGATEKLKPMSEAEKTDIRNDREFSDRNRRSTVEAALREGKPVPESVLADYPDLKPTPAATGATGAKMPWEMTQAEFVTKHKAIDAAWQEDKSKPSTSSFGKFYGKDYQEYLDSGKFGKETNYSTYEQQKHRSEVANALREGKPVPESVLADYPDLQREQVSRKIDLSRNAGTVDVIAKVRTDYGLTQQQLRDAHAAWRKKSGEVLVSDASSFEKFARDVVGGSPDAIDAINSIKPTPAATGATAQKMPWEMTREEFARRQHELERGLSERKSKSFDEAVQGLVDAGETPVKALEYMVSALEGLRKPIVERALREGKPVPESVLADYKGEKWADDALAKLKPAETGAEGGGIIERILDAYEKPERARYVPVQRNELMGSNGKWYSGDMPIHLGVKPTGEKRPYWVAQLAREGTTHGNRFNTRDELVADIESGLARRRAEFKTELDKMDAAELQSQADYWLPKPQATTPTTPTPAHKPAKQKQRRQSKSMVSADKISDFQTGRDRVERRGDGTYVVDTTGQYAPVMVQSDVMTTEAADRIRNLPADKRAMARETTARTPYLSPEGRAERLAVFDEAKPTPAATGAVGQKPETLVAQKTIRDLYGTRTESANRIQRDILNGFSFVEDMTPEKALSEMAKSKEIWNGEVERLKLVGEEKQAPNEKDIQDLRYWEGKSGKQIPIWDWVENYGLPAANESLSKVNITEGAIQRLLSLNKRRTKAVVDPSPPAATGAAAQKQPWEMTRDEFSRHPGLKTFKPGEKGSSASASFSGYENDGETVQVAISRLHDGLIFQHSLELEKMPWEMTRDAYAEANSTGAQLDASDATKSVGDALGQIMRTRQAGDRVPTFEEMAKELTNKDGTTYWDTIQRGEATDPRRIHEESVRNAIREGKRVPESVLADYPDLKPAPPAAETVEQGKQPRSRTAAQEFDDLVAEYGEQEGWGSDLPSTATRNAWRKGPQAGSSVKGTLNADANARQAAAKALFDLKDVGGKGNDPTAAHKAEMLPKLKEYLAKKAEQARIEEEAANAPDTIDNLPADVPHDPNDPFSSPPATPKLRPGENQGDVFANQTEDFALVGEKSTDANKVAEAKAKAERDAAEAKRIQDEQQQDLFAGSKPDEAFGSKNTIVTTDRANELIARMKAKLKQGPKNVSMLGTGGIDPSLFSDAVQLGAYYIEGGWHKFVDWIAKLREHFTAEELSDKHLRSIYATARITIESPIGQDRSKHPPGLQPGLRPPAERIIIARPEFTKQADESIIPKQIAEHLDPHQRQGVATALKSLLERGGFLLADGTGAGKTRQALAVAEHYAKQGHRVIIVTKSETIKQNWKKNTFGGSYAYDSGKMGIKLTLDRDGLSKPGSIGITTYENLNQVANRTDSNTVLIFDESHALKNDSQRAKKGLRAIAKAKAVMFMSATPADKAEHIYYLARMGVMEGKSVQQALKDLGMKLVSMDKMVKGSGGWSKRTVTFWAEDQNVSETDRNKMFSSLFDRLTSKGAMLKREISMEGTHVQVLKIALPPEAHDAMARELTTAARAYHLPSSITTDDLKGLRKALVLGNQRRQLEPYKIASAVILAQRELAAGRQVVIFVSRVNESESGYNEKVKTFSGETETVRHVSTRSEGTAKLLREALEDVGIHDIAEIHGNSDQGSLEAMADYQAGKKRVVVATIESGGTGINLDDTVGNKPRTIIVVTAPFDAVGNVQAAGRIWRLKTLSGANIFYLFGDTAVDDWNADIIGSKMATLGAVVEGQVRRLDISNPESVTTDDFSEKVQSRDIVESKIRDAQARIDKFGSTVRKSKGEGDYTPINERADGLLKRAALFRKTAQGLSDEKDQARWIANAVALEAQAKAYGMSEQARLYAWIDAARMSLPKTNLNVSDEALASAERWLAERFSRGGQLNSMALESDMDFPYYLTENGDVLPRDESFGDVATDSRIVALERVLNEWKQNPDKAEKSVGRAAYRNAISKLSESADPFDLLGATKPAEERATEISKDGYIQFLNLAAESSTDAEHTSVLKRAVQLRESTMASKGSTVKRPISEQAATQAVNERLGTTVMPSNIRFVNDPSPESDKGSVTYKEGQLPQITINLAKHDTSDSIKDTLVHELLHPVQDNPALASAVGSVAALVQEADLSRKQAIGYDENETQIEATNELIRKFYQEHANSNIFQRAVTQVIIAAKRIFGIELTAKQASVILVQDAVKNHVAKAGGATRFSKYSETASQQDRQVPEGRVVTERNGIEDTAPGFSLGRHERDNGVTYAELKFEEAGIPTYRGNGDLLFVKKEARDVDHQVELDALLRLVKDTIRISNELGDYGSVFLQSVREMVAGQIAQEREGRGVMFTNRDVFNELANLSYSYFSNLGKRLSMMARNSSGGELLDILEGSVSLPERLRYEVLNGYFGGIDSDAIQKIIDVVKNQTGSDVLSDTDVAEFLKSLLLKVNRQYPGGTVYKLAHKRLSVKEADSLKKLLSKAKVQEAVQFIIELAKRNGVDEPPQKTKQLTPPEKLFAMVNEKHVDAINASLFEAIRQAERNAARAVWIKEESPDEDAIALYDSETEVAGTSDVGPTQEQVEAGLDDPKFAHWRVVRDSLLGYSPVTDKLIQKVIQWDIKGTDFSDPNAPKQVDSREIDLGKLSIAPDEEVDRVFQAYLDKLEEQMDLNGATQTTKDRIRASIQAKLDDQLAMVRAKKLNIFFNPVTRVASTATGKLGALINLGIDADARYKDSPSLNRLLQKIASKFASVEDMDELARKSRSEKFAAVRDAVEDALSEANISDTNTEFQAYARQVAFNHIATRLFNAESGIVRSVTDSKDVLFGPKAPKTKEEQARIRGDQLQALHDSIEAGVADTVTMDSLARKKLLNQLTPKLTELIKLLATLPISEQNAKADLFVATVMSELGVIDPANVDKVAGSLKRAFIRKLDAAKQSAVEAFLKEKITAVKKPGVLDGVRKLVNSGFFTDSRLSDPDFVSKVASKGAITRLLPNIKEIIKTVLATPVKNQKELGRVFADELAKKLGIDPSQVAGAAAAFAKAYKDKFEKARESSLKAAGNALYPKEREILFANNNKLWEKISDFVRSGGLDDNEFFREFARSKWGDKRVASDRDIAKLRDLVDQIEQLTQLTSKETLRAGSDPARIATAKKERARVQAHSIQLLQRRIEAMMKEWSSPTADNVLDWIKDPVLRRNRNAALNELASSNVLLGVAKFGRQLFDTLTFQPWYVGHRAISNTFNGFLSGVAGGANPSSIQLFKNLSSDLAGVLRVRIATIGHPLRAFSQAVKGRGLPTHVDNLKSGMLMAERLNIRAQELQDKGTPASIVRSYLMRFWALQTLGHRQFGAIDVLQAKSAEWQEMLSQVRAGLRAKGVSEIEINEQSDSIFSNISSDLITARDDAEAILTSATNTPSKSEINAQAWELLQTRLYARIKAIGLNADQFEERNAAYTSTIAWNRPPGGLGGIIAKNMKAVQKWAEPGMPLPTMMFGNAIGTSLNRGMTWIGMGLFPGMFKDDPWYETDVDKLHRKMEAITGVAMQTALGSLVLMGYIIVRLGWPKDKKEREEWQAKGIKPFTIEFPLGDGTNLAIPLRVGPLAPMAGGLAGAAAMRALIEKKHKEQQKLNDDASKLGVEPGKATPINAADLLAVAGKSAWEMLSSGRTASGMLGTYSDYGNMNVGRIVSALASPLIPLLPAYQELTRLAGINIDANIGSFWDMLVPSPWSPSKRVNMLGDSVATPGDLERILGIVTLGGGVTRDIKSDNTPYASLYQTGARPQAISRTKGYNFGVEIRPMTKSELAEFAVSRGVNLKSALADLGPIDGMSPADAKKAVQYAIRTSDNRALASMGITVKQASSRASSGIKTARRRSMRSTSARSSSPYSKKMKTFRHRSLRPSSYKRYNPRRSRGLSRSRNLATPLM